MNASINAPAAGGTRRARGFAGWRPQGVTVDLVNAITDVVDDNLDYRPLTTRQILHELARRSKIDLTPRSYDRLQETMTRARRARIIPFDILQDAGAYSLDTCTEHLHRFNPVGQDEQTTFAEIWTTQPALLPQLARVADDLGIPTYGITGFATIGTAHALAQRVAARDVPTWLFWLADYGRPCDDAIRALVDDAQAFAEGLGCAPKALKSTRMTLTEAQLDRYGIVPTQSQVSGEKTGQKAPIWPVEGLEPARLARIVTACRILQDKATAADLAEAAQYEIEEPVDLPASESLATAADQEIDWSRVEIGPLR